MPFLMKTSSMHHDLWLFMMIYVCLMIYDDLWCHLKRWWFRWEDMGLHEAAEMLIYRSLIPEKKKNAELQVLLLLSSSSLSWWWWCWWGCWGWWWCWSTRAPYWRRKRMQKYSFHDAVQQFLEYQSNDSYIHNDFYWMSF